MNNSSLGEYLILMSSGDRDAFVKLYEELKRPVFTVIFRIVTSRESAEDITQEFFIKLYKSPPKERIKNPRAWLFMSARNMAIDHIRSRRPYEELDENIQYEDDIAADMDVEGAIASLEKTEREIVTLHLNCELTFSEISEIMGLSMPSVYRRYRKAIGKMKEKLQGGCYGGI